jgi:peptidoglycan/LPS O-acetylase OafA/YrhL
MKKKQIAKEINSVQPQNKRIVFFDIVRILCVAAIVYIHLRYPFVPSWFDINKIFFSDGYFFNIYTFSISGIAVYGMILVSGAVIEYKYKEIFAFSEYVSFISKRFIRIYPAFWMSLILGLLCFPGILFNTSIFNIIFQFTGFYSFLGIGPSSLNLMEWFIGTIFALYLLFPLLSKIIKKYQLSALIAIMFVSLISRYILFTYNPVHMYNIFRWLPICNMFEFCLGIYIIQNSFYPKNTTNHPTIEKISDLSFYIFLFHVIIIQKLAQLFPTSPVPNTENIFYFVVLGVVIVISWIAMLADMRIQKYLLYNPWIKKNLLRIPGS